MTYQLDTDTCIHILRGCEAIIEKIKTISPEEIAVSSITHYELTYGALRCAEDRREIEARKVQQFVTTLHQLPFTERTAQHVAAIRAQLEAQGEGIGPMDTLIAASAQEADLTLVTGNTREFSRVLHLKVENWIA